MTRKKKILDILIDKNEKFSPYYKHPDFKEALL